MSGITKAFGLPSFEHPTDKMNKDAIKAIPIENRLIACTDIIGELCSESRTPCMSLPVQPYDEDEFMITTIEEARAKIKEFKQYSLKLCLLIEKSQVFGSYVDAVEINKNNLMKICRS